jgi:hypothetical protein
MCNTYSIYSIILWHDAKRRIEEPEEVTVARQQRSKHAPTATDMHATIEELLEGVFSVQSILRLYNKDQRDQLVS